MSSSLYLLPQLVFNGGTSLAKAYHVIRRFSEDIDITYDIRAIAPDLVRTSPEPLPPNRSQEKRWTSEIRSRLAEWVSRTALPLIDAPLSSSGLPAGARADGDKIVIDYQPLATGSGYARPSVFVEFGARSTGESHVKRHPVLRVKATSTFTNSRSDELVIGLFDC